MDGAAQAAPSAPASAPGASPCTPAELEDLRVRRSRLAARVPQWQPLAQGAWLERCAAEHGDRPLVLTDDVCLTYAAVEQQARELADGLHALGVRPGDHVGMVLANFPEFVPLKFAIARAGAVAVPLNFLYRTDELADVLRRCDCRVLVTMTGFAGLDHLAMLDAIEPGWDVPGGPSRQRRLPALRAVVQLSTDGRTRAGVPTVADLAALGRSAAGATAGLKVDPLSVGDIMVTSGSTGAPKGVMVTHDAVLRTAYASALTRAFEDGRRILFSLPCYHMFGYVEGLLAATVVGGSVVLQSSFTGEGYLRGVATHRATDVLAVPTMAIAMLEALRAQQAPPDLSSLRAMLVGAAPGPAWLWERVARDLGVREIVTGYGMTETGGAQTLTRPEDPYELTATTVGRPKSAGVAGLAARGGDLCWYRTLDPLTGEPLPEGAVGEIVCTGPTAMVGYWGQPEETAATLHEGWVRSGDLGRVLPDGSLQITGRSKELYKSGGELVMPREVEEVVAAHPAVSQVFAVGVPDERWGEVGCLCVVRTPEGVVDEAEIIDLCRARLARFKVPKHVWFTDAADLPLTPTGKVQKFRLVELAQQRLERSDEHLLATR